MFPYMCQQTRHDVFSGADSPVMSTGDELDATRSTNPRTAAIGANCVTNAGMPEARFSRDCIRALSRVSTRFSHARRTSASISAMR